jgi:hypothetical protein
MTVTIDGTTGVSLVQDGVITTAKIASSTLVGTVSESSGTPTGAIIERGSNANGEFVKFADGTLICHLNSLSTSSSSDVTWTYPSAFSTTTGLVVTGMGRGSDTDRIISTGGVLTTTTATIRAYVATNGSRSSTTVCISAIGRWY